MWFGVILVLTMMNTGCMSAFLTTAYLFGGDLTPAEFKDLKGKKVVVVCRPQVPLPVGGRDAAQKLAKQVGMILKRHVSKIKVVNHDKVADWMDNNSFEEYVDLGRAMEADVVLSIDLAEYDIHEGQTLLRGKAQYTVTVTDCRTTEELFTKTPDRAVWPPNTGVPTMSQNENAFQRKFINVLADEISRSFYRHDGRSNFADDVTAL
jgi:hypothetical protein